MKKNKYQKPRIREVALQQQLLNPSTTEWSNSRELNTSNLFSEEP